MRFDVSMMHYAANRASGGQLIPIDAIQQAIWLPGDAAISIRKLEPQKEK